jgi:hypothetical protein
MPDAEGFQDLHFPKAGIDVSQGFNYQPNKPCQPDGTYARTARVGLNVRGWDVNQRVRGGSRCGISKYVPQPVVAGWLLQQIDILVGTGYSPPGGVTLQYSQSGRVVTLVAVSQGNVFVVTPGATSWTPTINMTGASPPLNFTGLVYSAPNNQKLWFADGINYCYYDPSQNTVFPWNAALVDASGNPLSGNALPVDVDGNTPRLIVTWRGRTVLSGLIKDPQNFFMSATSDPTNFDYEPQFPNAAQAVAGNTGPLGYIGDVVTSMCPYTNDILIFFGDHTIYMLQGDPLAGGTLVLVSNEIGGQFGICWCMDGYGTIYFVSNRMGVYSFVPGSLPQRISQPIESLLLNLDTGFNNFRLQWDDRFQGFHLFCTPLLAPGTTTHFFWEARTQAWWQQQYGSDEFDPLCCVTYDGNTPGDRVPLIGSWDGYVRAIDPTATTDDGIAISSQVVIGPLLTPNFDDMLIKDLQGILGISSGTVNYAVYAGFTAEQALSNTPMATGTLSAGLNYTDFIRTAGHAIYIELTSTSAWAMEAIRVRVATQGKVRMRRGKG